MGLQSTIPCVVIESVHNEKQYGGLVIKNMARTCHEPKLTRSRNLQHQTDYTESQREHTNLASSIPLDQPITFAWSYRYHPAHRA